MSTSFETKCSKPKGEYCRLHNPQPQTKQQVDFTKEEKLAKKKTEFKTDLLKTWKPDDFLNTPVAVDDWVNDAIKIKGVKKFSDLSTSDIRMLNTVHAMHGYDKEKQWFTVEDSDGVDIESVDDAIDAIYVSRNGEKLTAYGKIEYLDFVREAREHFNLSEEEFTEKDANKFLNENNVELEKRLQIEFGANFDGGSAGWDGQSIEFPVQLRENQLNEDDVHEELRENTRIINAHNALNGAYQTQNFWYTMFQGLEHKN